MKTESMHMTTGATRKVVPIKALELTIGKGRLPMMSGITVNTDPVFFIASQNGDCCWEDMFVESPADLHSLVELLEMKAQAVSTDSEWNRIVNASLALARSSRAGIKARVAEVQAKTSRRTSSRAA